MIIFKLPYLAAKNYCSFHLNGVEGFFNVYTKNIGEISMKAPL